MISLPAMAINFSSISYDIIDFKSFIGISFLELSFRLFEDYFFFLFLLLNHLLAHNM